MIDLQVVIPDDVYQKIMWWINKSNHEVSGFGSLDFDAVNGIFTVRDAILLKQEVAPTSTEIDPVAIGKAMYEMREEKNALKWHWHSHVDMGVFWSGDDKTLIKNLGSQGWIAATVFNKKREMKSAFYTIVDIGIMGIVQKKELFLEDVPTRIQRYLPNALCKAWDKQYDEHVKVTVPKVYTYGTREKKSGFVALAKRGVVAEKPFDYHDKRGWQTNDDGFRWSYSYNRWVYNPVFDKSLKTDEEKLEMLKTMDSEEVDAADMYYEDKAKEFDRLYKILRPEEEKKLIGLVQ